MTREFPHLNDTPFPYLNTQDAYTYRNDFDYSQWGVGLCIRFFSVPWNNLEQAVQFSSDELRDKWFDDHSSETVTIDTAMEQVPTDYIDVPLPYMSAINYNYIELTYQIQPNPDKPLDFTDPNGVYRYHYFIDSCVQLAPSTTRLYVEQDLWMTYINRVDVSYMMLARGHAPMFSTIVEKYLENPILNSADLLAPDVTFGNPVIVQSSDEIVFNSYNDTYAVIASSAALNVSADERVPASQIYIRQGAPSSFTCAIDSSDITAFLNALSAQIPHLIQTIEAIYFIGKQYVSVSDPFTLVGYELQTVIGKQTNFDLLKLTRESFGYPARYADIAKLYTYPYACIEVTNGQETHQIMIEETEGSVSAQAMSSVSFPKAGIDVILAGIGGIGNRSITFKNVGNRSINVAGRWYEGIIRYEIPTYAVQISAATQYDYSTRYERAQNALAANNSYDSAVASADVSVTNTANSGKAQTSNTALATAASVTTTARNNQASTTITSIGNSTSQAAQAYDAGLQRGVQEVDAQSQSATTAANTVGSLAGSVVSGAMSGGALGAIGGLVSSAISGVTAGVTNAILLNAASEKVELTISNSQNKVSSQNDANSRMTSNTNSAQSDNVATANSAQTSQTRNSVNVANTNAKNSAAVSKANAKCARDTSLAGIQAGIDQAALRAPSQFGIDTGTAAAITQPLVFSANVVTQTPSAISQAGEQFLRFGYALNKPVEVASLALRDGFTYWLAADVIITPKGTQTSAIANAINAIRTRLLAGVTVWSDPDLIGVW